MPALSLRELVCWFCLHSSSLMVYMKNVSCLIAPCYCSTELNEEVVATHKSNGSVLLFSYKFRLLQSRTSYMAYGYKPFYLHLVSPES